METIKIRIPLIITRPISDSEAVEQMKAAIDKLIKVGSLKGDPSDFIINYEVKNYDSEHCVVVEINKENLVDVAPFLTVAGGLCLDDENFDWEQMKIELPKTFSTASIQERLNLSKKDPRSKFRYTILDYRRWWNSKKDTVDSEVAGKVVQLFLSDLTQMFNEILPEIQEGKQLQSLLGVNSVSNKLTKVAKELSLAYRKALKQEASNGAPNKTTYQNLSEKYREFMTSLIPEVFPGIDKVLVKQQNPQTKKSFSYKRLPDGRIDLYSEPVVRVYSKCEDGRIDLFSKSYKQYKDEERLRNQIFVELKKKWGEQKFNKMTFDEIFEAVEREFIKRNRIR